MQPAARAQKLRNILVDLSRLDTAPDLKRQLKQQRSLLCVPDEMKLCSAQALQSIFLSLLRRIDITVHARHLSQNDMRQYVRRMSTISPAVRIVYMRRNLSTSRSLDQPFWLDVRVVILSLSKAASPHDTITAEKLRHQRLHLLR